MNDTEVLRVAFLFLSNMRNVPNCKVMCTTVLQMMLTQHLVMETGSAPPRIIVSTLASTFHAFRDVDDQSAINKPLLVVRNVQVNASRRLQLHRNCAALWTRSGSLLSSGDSTLTSWFTLVRAV